MPYDSAIQWQRQKLLYYNVAVYILVESEDCSLNWKAKQGLTDTDKWQKNNQKNKQWQNNGLLQHHRKLNDVIYHQFFITKT